MFETCGGCCVLLILVPLVCCVLGGGVVMYVNANAPEPPISENFTASRAEAQAFDAEIQRAKTMATTNTSGWFTVTFTERQVSSWLEYEGATLADDENNVFPFHDIQVGLDDGQMTFYGKMDRLDLPVEVVLTPVISGDGAMEFEITSVDVGGLGLPGVLLDSVSDQFRDMVIKPFDDLPGDALYFDAQSFYLDDGTFIVQGLAR